MSERGAGCLFCRIVAGEVPAKLLHQDERVVAFRDVNPKAPFHALIVPVEHVATLDDLGEGQSGLAGEVVLRATRLAREHGLAEGGYRLVWNCGVDAGQTVFHLHLHLLGGRGFSWPPG
ncbi:MAG: histidine triad nucleotide-binding protein [Gemmatimonadota bacterium]